MFKKLLEWLASQSDPRFRASRDARLLLEDYLVELGVAQEDLSPEQRSVARQNPSLQEAERLYLRAIISSEQEEALSDVAVGHFQLGRLFHLQGRWGEAVEAFHRALQIYQDLPQADREQRQAIGDCHYWLGRIALAQGGKNEARRELEQSLEIDTALGNRDGQKAIRKALALCDLP